MFWAVLLTNAFDQGLRFSIDKATFELLYLPIPSHIKTNVKGTIDLLVSRLGDGVGGVLLGLATQGFAVGMFTLPGLGFGLRGIAAVCAVACAVWVGLAWRCGAATSRRSRQHPSLPARRRARGHARRWIARRRGSRQALTATIPRKSSTC